jgi:hypothetical protein
MQRNSISHRDTEAQREKREVSLCFLLCVSVSLCEARQFFRIKEYEEWQSR